MDMKAKILVLCTGNSCRSQMAEGYLRSLDSGLEVYSAGTIPAVNVNPNAIEVMNDIGIDISGQSPQNVDEFVNKSFDYVITVCDDAKEVCPVFSGQVKNRLHIGFEDPYNARGTHEEVIGVYKKVRDQIRNDFKKFYDDIAKESE
jgi:arsenate reductase (thioredoxin)